MTEPNFHFDRQTIDQIDYLAESWAMEDECERITDALLPTLGTKAPKTLPAMGVLLGYLDGISSCVFGCSSGDHLLEQQLLRVCNRTRAAIRLSRLSFYDESLMLTRANAETANLLILFTYETSALTAWKAQEKWTQSPARVRLKLESHTSLFPANEIKYNLLSGMAAHSDPGFIPSAHNSIKRPVAAGRVQELGLLRSINETALQLVWVSIAVRQLMQLPADISEGVRDGSLKLIEVAGSVTADFLPL